MPASNTGGITSLARLRRRYETTEKNCPGCGLVDEGGNWTSRPDGSRPAYQYVYPNCGAGREHTLRLDG